MLRSMNDGMPEDEGRLENLLRGILVGGALAIVISAGMELVLAQAVAIPSAALVVIATGLVAFTVGIWAGMPDTGTTGNRAHQRWLHAGAPTAVAGAYASFSTLYQQIYPGPFWAVVSLVMVTAIPAYAIGLIPPALAASSMATAEDAGEEPPLHDLGNLAFGVLIGAAIGTLGTGLIVLQLTGPGSALMGAAALLLLPLAMREEHSAARETTLYETISPFGALQVTEVLYPGERQPERKLYLNGEEESAELVRSGAPTLAYIAAAESFLATITPPGAVYLFLGGGAYTLPRRLLERDSSARAVVVELDPEVTRIAYQYFNVSTRYAISSVNGDARAYLDAAGDARYDRIYVDVYSGQEALPYSLVTAEAAQAMRDRLEPDGILALNLIGTVTGAEIRRPWSVVHTFAEVFPSVAVYAHFGRDYPDAQNLLLVASGDPARAFPAVAGVFDEWPREEWPSPAGLIVFRDLLTDPGQSLQSPSSAGQAVRAGERRI